MIRDIGFVRNENDCVSALIQIFEERHDFIAGFRIEIASGFIRQDDGWIVYQSPRDGDTLALTARKLVRLVVQTITESYLPQHVRGLLAACFRINASINERELYIPQAVSARKKIERLKNKTDLAIANARQLIIRHARNVASIKFIASGTRRIEAAKHVHQRRFAAATGAHDCEVLVAANLQRHAAQRVNNLFAHHVVLRDVLDVDDYRIQ